MKNFKGFALGLVLGLGLAFSGIAFAQNTSQTDQKKEMQSCCAMKHDAKDHAAEGSCCCSGGSCDMNMKHDAKDGTKEACCCSDSCDMKMKHDMTEKPRG